jgi:SH3 domain-containing YSC84-like protein 1
MVNSPIPTSLHEEVQKAARILRRFVIPDRDTGPDKLIPSTILEEARGLAILSILKAGFLFSARGGSGIVVARLPDGSWSAPSAIRVGGLGAGFQIGAELTDFVIILNNQRAVNAFSHGNVTLGGNLSIAIGPIGRNAEAGGAATIAAMYSYSRTKGLFAGVSLEGTVLIERKDTNEKFYGRRVPAKDLLDGVVPSPREAAPLYASLNLRASPHRRSGADGFQSVSPTAIPTSTSSNYRSRPSEPPVVSSEYPPSYAASVDAGYSRNVDTRKPPPLPVPQSRLKARALFDFTPVEMGDLSFHAGDIIEVNERTTSQNDWWTGTCHGQKGTFPANYVELLL